MLYRASPANTTGMRVSTNTCVICPQCVYKNENGEIKTIFGNYNALLARHMTQDEYYSILNLIYSQDGWKGLLRHYEKRHEARYKVINVFGWIRLTYLGLY